MPLSTSSSSSSRRLLVAWLYALALAHLSGGVLLTWGGHSGLLDSYLTSVEHAFWTTEVPAAARAQQVWWVALFGATLQAYAWCLLALVHIGNTLRRPMAWGWLMAGLLLWAPQDIVISLSAGMWSHLLIDLLALLVLLPPLFWLYRHDRRSLIAEA
jgi:hypothetical protein